MADRDLLGGRPGLPVLPGPRSLPDRPVRSTRTRAAYVRAIAEGDTARGYAVARAPNPLASICGRICAHPCETKCRRGVDRPADLDPRPEAHADRAPRRREHAGRASRAPLRPLRPRRRRRAAAPARVAVVGAGPAGLSCAHDLALLGYRRDALRRGAGRRRHAVPGRARVPPVARPDPRRGRPDPGARRRAEARTGGSAATSRSATCAATATRPSSSPSAPRAGRELNIPGQDLDGVINGVDFLLNANLGYRVTLGERVVVVGGGNVAIDVARTALRYAAAGDARRCPRAPQQLLQTWGYDNAFLDAARTALRLGARHVQLVSLESRARDAGPSRRGARGRGGGHRARCRGRGPKAILGQDGHVVGARDARRRVACSTRTAASTRRSRRAARSASRPTRSSWPSASSPTPPAWPADPEITITPRGLVAVEPRTLATTMPGVYCGGDLAFGPRIVIEAVADGKRAALAIHESLGGGAVPRARGRFRPIALNRAGDRYDRDPAPGGARACPSRGAPASARSRRATARRRRGSRRSRCLWCNVETVFDSERCILCSGCVEICPEACLALVPVSRLRGTPGAGRGARGARGRTPTPGAIVKDEERCIRCGLCAERCPDRRHHDGGAGARRVAADRARALPRGDERGARDEREGRRPRRGAEPAGVLPGRLRRGRAASAGFVASTFRFLVPTVLYEPSRALHDRQPRSSFPPGSVTFLADRRLFLFNGADGFSRVSSVCTHLGCNVKRAGTGLRVPVPRQPVRRERAGRPRPGARRRSPGTRSACRRAAS